MPYSETRNDYLLITKQCSIYQEVDFFYFFFGIFNNCVERHLIIFTLPQLKVGSKEPVRKFGFTGSVLEDKGK